MKQIVTILGLILMFFTSYPTFAFEDPRRISAREIDTLRGIKNADKIIVDDILSKFNLL